MTLNYLLSENSYTKIFPRYLFESSILEKCCFLRCQIYQFPMTAYYGKNWRSSMESRKMIIPILSFWLKFIFKRIFNHFLFNLNLGSLLLAILNLSVFSYLYIVFINNPKYILGNICKCWNSCCFYNMMTISLICFCLFFFYDYNSGKRIKIVNFRYFIKDINHQKIID